MNSRTPTWHSFLPLPAVLATVLAANTTELPHPPNSTIPCGITLVGTNGGVADSRGEFVIVVRDFTSDPIPGSLVVIVFDGCEQDIAVCSAQPMDGVIARCDRGPVGWVSAVTNALGRATLRIVGAARNQGTGGPFEGFGCATVYADGVLLGNVNVAALDQDASGGLNPADLSLILTDLFSGGHRGRSDFNCSNTLNPADLSIWLNAYFADGSTSSCGSFCN